MTLQNLIMLVFAMFCTFKGDGNLKVYHDTGCAPVNEPGVRDRCGDYMDLHFRIFVVHESSFRISTLS